MKLEKSVWKNWIIKYYFQFTGFEYLYLNIVFKQFLILYPNIARWKALSWNIILHN